MGERVNSKADQVYGELKEAILSGALEPGELIDKSALCERLGVSRFPVSAAVSRLAFEHLVVIEPQHGSFVARISADDVRERLFIRRALEGEIAAEAARRMPREGLEALEDNLARERKAVEAGDRASFYALDVGFHQALTDASRPASQRRDSRRRARASGAGAAHADVAAGPHSPNARRARGDRRGDRSGRRRVGARRDGHDISARRPGSSRSFARERPELISA